MAAVKAANLLIIQGGGPTAVFNASLSAAISEAFQLDRFERVYGAHSCFEGLVRGEYLDLGRLTPEDLKLLRRTPGAALGSSRYKPTEADFEQMVRHLRRLAIRNLLFIGGNGTMCGAAAVSRFCRSVGYEVQVLCAPKTVDNDIEGTDRSPGFGSAARYIAQATQDLGRDVQSLPQPVSILETMGRSVGWLAAASVLGKREERDAPHLIYVPERAFSVDSFLGDLEQLLGVQRWVVVVVAEGLRDEAGALIYQTSNSSQSDALKRPLTGGVAEYLAGVAAEHLRVRCRSEKPGLLGRASMAHVSAQDLSDAELVGRTGVRGFTDGHTDKMVALRPLTDGSETGVELVEVSVAAGHTRAIPAHLLSDSALCMHADLIRYLSPLAGELPPYFNSAAMGVPNSRGLDG